MESMGWWGIMADTPLILSDNFTRAEFLEWVGAGGKIDALPLDLRCRARAMCFGIGWPPSDPVAIPNEFSACR